MRGPCFYVNNLRATTIIIDTTADNNIDQHEPTEKGADCQVSDHNSIGSEVSEGLSAWGGTHLVDPHAPVECVGWDPYS